MGSCQHATKEDNRELQKSKVHFHINGTKEGKIEPSSKSGAESHPSKSFDTTGIHNRKTRYWKARHAKRHVVVGEDVAMSDIPSLLGRTVVARFNRKIVKASSLATWLDTNWSTMLGYWRDFHTLSRTWIVFRFGSKEDLEKIINRV